MADLKTWSIRVDEDELERLRTLCVATSRDPQTVVRSFVSALVAAPNVDAFNLAVLRANAALAEFYATHGDAKKARPKSA